MSSRRVPVLTDPWRLQAMLESLAGSDEIGMVVDVWRQLRRDVSIRMTRATHLRSSQQMRGRGSPTSMSIIR